MFMQLLFNGLIAGSIYALVAVGFSLIYKTTKFIHFAHGAVISFSAYAFFQLIKIWDMNLVLSIILALLFASLLGWFLDFTIYKRLRKRNASSSILLIASIALLILLESVILLIWGANVKTISLFPIGKGLSIFGAIITPLQILILVVSVILLVLLFLFLQKTKIGKAMRAVSDNKDVAEILGISKEKIYSISFIIGSFIAGVAGILIGMEQNLVHTMGTNLLIKGFVGSIIGGITSVPGSILGSYLLGIVENFGIWWLPSGYKDAIAFTLLFIFLLFMPYGLFGKRWNK